MTPPIHAVWERSGKSYDLKDADGRLVGIVFLEADAKEICGAVNGQKEPDQSPPSDATINL